MQWCRMTVQEYEWQPTAKADSVWRTLSRQAFHLGTGHYLSPGGGAGEDFRGGHLIFGRTKAGISRNREPKRGDRESHQKLLGGITSVK